MRFLAAAGLVTLLAGIGSYYAVGERTAFSTGNIVLGGLLFLVAAVLEARSFRGFSGGHSRRVLLRWSAIGLATLALVVVANVLASASGFALDLTVARQYTLSEQSLALCEELAGTPSAARAEILLFEDALLARDVRLLVAAYVSS